jgi:molecular chaperone Hsp33
LAEALVLTALIGSLLKDDDSQLTIPDRGRHRRLVRLRLSGWGSARLCSPRCRPARRWGQPSLFALFGKGYLAVTIDGDERPALSDRPLEGASLVDACGTQSEQVRL